MLQMSIRQETGTLVILMNSTLHTYYDTIEKQRHFTTALAFYCNWEDFLSLEALLSPLSVSQKGIDHSKQTANAPMVDSLLCYCID